MKLNICFNKLGGEQWTVGPIFLRNLIFALRQFCKDEVILTLMSYGKNGNDNEYDDFIKPDQIVVCEPLQHGGFGWFVGAVNKKYFSRDLSKEVVLLKNKVNILFSTFNQFKINNIATLAYLPDFQPYRMPEMFSEVERKCLIRDFEMTVKHSTRVILTGLSIKKDFESFFPKQIHKVRIFKPVSYIPDYIYDDKKLASFLKLYNLPDKFVYLPNQFWKHKNHKVLFNAVKILKERGIDIIVVCTGNSFDYRCPSYFAKLWHQISELKIRDQIIYLGLIPHDYIFYLMRASVCIVNPSFFEGWANAVEEARSLGKMLLLSDIPIHREQMLSRSDFFDPYSAEDLAKKIEKIWVNTSSGPDLPLESIARRELSDRQSEFAKSFLSIAQEAISEVWS
ncbi:MAG: glycosyltransferase family 1 protein [Candidatus Omnitrophota bacterium]